MWYNSITSSPTPETSTICVIIHSTTGRIPEEYLKEGNKCNPHGYGLVARTPGGLRIRRGFSTKTLLKAYAQLVEKGVTEMVFHARIGTSGTIGIENTHPFKINDTAILFHNGILGSTKCDRNKKMCDTWHYARQLEDILSVDGIDLTNPDLIDCIEKYAKDEASKFVIMQTDGPTLTFNKDAGVERDGIWFSNRSAFPFTSWATQSATPMGFSSTRARWDSVKNRLVYDVPASSDESLADWQKRTNAYVGAGAGTACDHGVHFNVRCKRRDRIARRRETFEEKHRTHGHWRESRRTQINRLRDERPANASMLDEVHNIMSGGALHGKQAVLINSAPYGSEADTDGRGLTEDFGGTPEQRNVFDRVRRAEDLEEAFGGVAHV